MKSLLDVGSATGRGLTDFAEGLPGALVCGVEPVAALLAKAQEAGVLQYVPLVRGTGESLPFADGSFDAVCEFSILHHVPNPSKVVSEMLRVARKMIVITDCNRFGQGALLARSTSWDCGGLSITCGRKASTIRYPMAMDCFTRTAFTTHTS